MERKSQFNSVDVVDEPDNNLGIILCSKLGGKTVS
jgi:hypothetical protein